VVAVAVVVAVVVEQEDLELQRVLPLLIRD
jgi:hypothetical protein